MSKISSCYKIYILERRIFFLWLFYILYQLANASKRFAWVYSFFRNPVTNPVLHVCSLSDDQWYNLFYPPKDFSHEKILFFQKVLSSLFTLSKFFLTQKNLMETYSVFKLFLWPHKFMNTIFDIRSKFDFGFNFVSFFIVFLNTPTCIVLPYSPISLLFYQPEVWSTSHLYKHQNNLLSKVCTRYDS